MGKMKLRFIRGYANATHADLTQVKNVPHRNSHRNRLPPDFAKCGGNFSLGHSLQTMAIAKRENENSVRNKSEHSIFYRKDKTRLGRLITSPRRLAASAAASPKDLISQRHLSHHPPLIFTLFANIHQLSHLK